MAEKKKFPVFWVCFAVFTALMVVFWGVVINNVKKSLVEYENSQPEYTVEKYLAQFRDGSIINKLILNRALTDLRRAEYTNHSLQTAYQGRLSPMRSCRRAMTQSTRYTMCMPVGSLLRR